MKFINYSTERDQENLLIASNYFPSSLSQMMSDWQMSKDQQVLHSLVQNIRHSNYSRTITKKSREFIENECFDHWGVEFPLKKICFNDLPVCSQQSLFPSLENLMSSMFPYAFSNQTVIKRIFSSFDIELLAMLMTEADFTIWLKSKSIFSLRKLSTVIMLIILMYIDQKEL